MQITNAMYGHRRNATKIHLIEAPEVLYQRRLPASYPLGNGYISHQTGSSENHWIIVKSALEKGYVSFEEGNLNLSYGMRSRLFDFEKGDLILECLIMFNLIFVNLKFSIYSLSQRKRDPGHHHLIISFAHPSFHRFDLFPSHLWRTSRRNAGLPPGGGFATPWGARKNDSTEYEHHRIHIWMQVL